MKRTTPTNDSGPVKRIIMLKASQQSSPTRTKSGSRPRSVLTPISKLCGGNDHKFTDSSFSPSLAKSSSVDENARNVHLEGATSPLFYNKLSNRNYGTNNNNNNSSSSNNNNNYSMRDNPLPPPKRGATDTCQHPPGGWGAPF